MNLLQTLFNLGFSAFEYLRGPLQAKPEDQGTKCGLSVLEASCTRRGWYSLGWLALRACLGLALFLPELAQNRITKSRTQLTQARLFCLGYDLRDRKAGVIADKLGLVHRGLGGFRRGGFRVLRFLGGHARKVKTGGPLGSSFALFWLQLGPYDIEILNTECI